MKFRYPARIALVALLFSAAAAAAPDGGSLNGYAGWTAANRPAQSALQRRDSSRSVVGAGSLQQRAAQLRPWSNQAGRLKRALRESGNDAALIGGGATGSSEVTILPPADPAARDPSAGNPAVAAMGIPGSDSPYTSTGNARGRTPYPDYDDLTRR